MRLRSHNFNFAFEFLQNVGHPALDCVFLRKNPTILRCGTIFKIVHNLLLITHRVIPRLHDEAGSTSWLVKLTYVSWTSQLDVCSMLARCLLDCVTGYKQRY